jgi:hypothetical protein
MDIGENMADIVKEVVGHNENLTETASSATSKIPTTPEGMAVAYGSLVIMALLPIFFGAFRSVKHHKEQKVTLHVGRIVEVVADCGAYVGLQCIRQFKLDVDFVIRMRYIVRNFVLLESRIYITRSL